jgi:hypothetical protein
MRSLARGWHEINKAVKDENYNKVSIISLIIEK